MPSSVFISYAREDATFVRKLHQKLSREDRQIWVDWEMPPAAEWQSEILEKIEEHDAFLYVITPDSVDSSVCSEEIEHASKYNKRIIPIVVRDVPTDDVPASARKIDWIFCRLEDDFDHAVERICEALDKDLEWIKEHTRLLGRAREWEEEGRTGDYGLKGEELERYERWIESMGDKEPKPTSLHMQYMVSSRQVETERLKEAVHRLETARRSLYALQLARVAALPNDDRHEGLRLLEDTNRCPPYLRDFSWGYLWRRSKRNPRTLYCRPGPVVAIAASWDGHLLATAAEDGNIELWNLPSLQRRVSLQGHSQSILAVAFSPDGGTFATGGYDRVVKLWRAADGEMLGSGVDHTLSITSIAFSPHGDMIASGSADRTVRLWDARTGEAARSALEHDSGVIGLAFSADGKRLASCIESGIIWWDLSSGRIDEKHDIDLTDVISVTFSSDGQTLAALNHDAVKIWDLIHYNERLTLPGGRLARAAISPDGKYLAVGGGVHTRWERSDELTVWDLSTGRKRERLRGHWNAVTDLTFMGDCQTLVSSSYDGTVNFWTFESTDTPDVVANPKDAVNAVRFVDEGKTLAIAAGSDLILYDTSSGGTRVLDVDSSGDVIALAACKERCMLYCAAESLMGTGGVYECQLGSGVVTKILDLSVPSLALSPDGLLLAIGARGEIKLWDVAAGQLRTARKAHRNKARVGDVTALDFSADGTLLASGGWDNAVEVWDTRTPDKVVVLKGHTATVIGVAFAENGQSVLSVSEKDPVLAGPNQYLQRQFPEMIRWDLDAEVVDVRVSVEDEAGIVTSLAVSPDGRTVATGHDTGTVSLWDPWTLEHRASLSFSNSPVQSLAFSPDSTVLSAGSDKRGSLMVADTPGEACIWRATDWRASVRFDGHQGQVYAVGFALQENVLAAVSGYDGGEVMKAGEVKLWDITTGDTRTLFTEHDNAVYHMAFSPDGCVLAVACKRGLRLIDVAAADDVAGFDAPAWSATTASVGFSPDGRVIVAGSSGRILKLYDRYTGHETHQLIGQYPMAVSDSGHVLLLGVEDDRLEIWDVVTRNTRRKLRLENVKPVCAAFAKGAEILAIGTADGRVLLWEVDTGRAMATLAGHLGTVRTVSFSADGTWLAACGGVERFPGEIKVWDVAQSKLVTTLRGHSDVVLSSAFSGDGKLATGGRSLRGPTEPGELILWDLVCADRPALSNVIR